MNADWYARQFGDGDHFAVSLALGHDPHPTGETAVDAAWGGLSLWVRGRCLTRSVSSDGAVSTEVRWSLLSILRWLLDTGARLVNEEPFPDATSPDEVRDGCEWFNRSERPLLTLTEEEEHEWFLRRSEWRHHHAFRRAAEDVALPNVMMRRLGDFVEVSWDNETWSAPRAGLSFVEQRGTELVVASRAARALREALIDVTQALAERHPDATVLSDLAVAASATAIADDGWRWLIHSQTARVIAEELKPLRERLTKHAKARRCGLYLPHTSETLILRQARLVSATEVTALLKAAQVTSAEPMKAPVRDLIHPAPASVTRPWLEGYDKAADVREALGWGDDPIHDLHAWLTANNVNVTTRGLPSSLDLVAVRTEDHRGSAVVNSQAQSHFRREIGQETALGHLLFDVIPVAVDGTWEHWPSAARARAFAIMLMLPDDGVRDVLAGRTSVDASDVKRVMDRYNTGPHATTSHLMNRGFIANDERRLEILSELVA